MRAFHLDVASMIKKRAGMASVVRKHIKASRMASRSMLHVCGVCSMQYFSTMPTLTSLTTYKGSNLLAGVWGISAAPAANRPAAHCGHIADGGTADGGTAEAETRQRAGWCRTGRSAGGRISYKSYLQSSSPPPLAPFDGGGHRLDPESDPGVRGLRV